jgi:hypothetical protein
MPPTDPPAAAPLDVAGLRRLLAEATPGPWADVSKDSDGHSWSCGCCVLPEESALIAAAVNALPQLLAIAEAAAAYIAAQQESHGEDTKATIDTWARLARALAEAGLYGDARALAALREVT